MRTSWPWSVSGRYDEGNGYGHSSHVMLPGFTSAGAGTAGAVWAEALPAARSSAPANTRSRVISIICVSSVSNPRLIQLRDTPAKRLDVLPDLLGFLLLVVVLIG